MFNQGQDSRWAEGQTNENNERTDDLDGAAEGENESANVSALPSQTAPASRPMSRGSYYGRDRDRGEPGDYHHGGSGRSRHRNPQGGSETAHNTSASSRTRNDSYRDPGGRMNGGYGYGDPYYPPRQPAYRYNDPYYMGGGYGPPPVGAYGGPPQPWMRNAREMLERLRVEDPVRYREWYNQYQAHRKNPQQVPDPGLPVYHGPAVPPAYGGMPPVGWQQGGPYAASRSDRSLYDEPRGPHSGRSSVNGEVISYNFPGMSYPNGPTVNQTPSIIHEPETGFQSLSRISDSHYHESPEPESKRMTPLKFNTAHSLGILTPLGQLIRVKQGSSSTIEIVQIKSLLNHLPEYKEVESFPGPLIKGTTHKNTVISFCQKKIKEAQGCENQVDKDHYILLWELLILLLRQNGNVVGSDIAELLVGKSNASRSVEDIISDDADSVEPAADDTDESSSAQEAINNATRHVSEAKATEKFCELLLYGHKKDALEYAMNNGLWGHALFLATKMDERTYGNVMARFANCIAFNHPLQTFYQLLSGKQPMAANSCCEESFGDWKPHLAMILSNAGVRPEVEVKSLTRMGDTLANKGLVYAAQFCYLMGKQEFMPNSKLGSLLGYCNAKKNIIEATQMTEIYEFALSLAEPNFTLGINFIERKLDYSKTLLSLGFVEEAFSYCEEITKKISLCSLKNTGVDVTLLKWSILQISERLVNIEESNNGVEPKWIQDLRSELTSKVKYERMESISDSASERRDSNADNYTMVKDYGEAHQTQELEQTTEPNYMTSQPQYDNVDSGQSTDGYNKYSQNPPQVVSNEGPSQYPNPTLNANSVPQSQPYNPMQPPMYNPQAMSNAQPDTNQNPGNGGNTDMMPPYFSGNSEPSMQYNPGMQSSVDSSGPNYYPNDPYNSQQYPNPGPYSADNNNYIPRGDGYNYMSQPRPGSDGTMGGVTGANNVKKKSVRFEEEDAPDGSANEDEIESEIIEAGAEENVETNDFAFCHQSKPRLRKTHVGEKKPIKEEPSCSIERENRRQTVGGCDNSPRGYDRRNEGFASRLAENLNPSKNFGGLKFNNTFPIDEPLPFPNTSFKPSRPAVNVGGNKTFPIDKHCCNENRLCKDHVDFYNGGARYGSLENLSTISASTSFKSNGIGQQGDTGNESETSSHSQSNEYNHLQQPNFPPPSQPQRPSQEEKQPKEKKPSSGGGGGDGKAKKSTGIFGGLMTKLGIKGPNQMILPDDKEPTIVWDPNLKKWVNTKEEEDGDSGPKGPPPTDFDLSRGPGSGPPPMMMQPPPFQPNGPPGLMQGPPDQSPPMMSMSNGIIQNPQPQSGFANTMPQMPQNVPLHRPDNFNMQQNQNQQNFLNNPGVPQTGAPNMINGGQSGPMSNGSALSNKYKLPKNRNPRAGYVDILNPGTVNQNRPSVGNGNAPDGSVSSAMNPSMGPPMIPNMFIPSPVSGSGDSGPISFLTPAPEGGPPIATAQNQSETN